MNRTKIRVFTPVSILIKAGMPDGIPYTVKRLMSVKPGETVCFYHGNLDADIQHAEKEKTYGTGRLLSKIRETMDLLVREGRIRVTTSTNSKIRTYRKKVKQNGEFIGEREIEEDYVEYAYYALGV